MVGRFWSARDIYTRRGALTRGLFHLLAALVTLYTWPAALGTSTAPLTPLARGVLYFLCLRRS